MLKRKIGRSDLEGSVICFGGNVFGWTADEKTSFDILDTFVGGGGDFIDTANVYSAWAPGHVGGESERVLGNWLASRKKRDQVVIATKIGMQMGDGEQGLSRSYIMREVEASLKRLRTDYIDLYQAHRDDQNTPLEEALEAFNDLIKQGKVRAIGASNYSAERLAEALKISEQQGIARYESLQPPYSLVNRETYEAELEPLCREQEIGVITYSSLASGFLTGKYRSGQDLPKTPRAQGIESKYMNKKGFAILETTEKIAKAHNATISQVALAWIITRPGITAPIASTTSVEQTKDLLKAADLQLNQEEIQLLDQVSAWK